MATQAHSISAHTSSAGFSSAKAGRSAMSLNQAMVFHDALSTLRNVIDGFIAWPAFQNADGSANSAGAELAEIGDRIALRRDELIDVVRSIPTASEFMAEWRLTFLVKAEIDNEGPLAETLLNAASALGLGANARVAS